ncbi:MAG: NHL repeat-containing protein [Candidatus Latescibacterota bacterium]
MDIYSGYQKHFSNPMGVAAVKHIFNDEPGPGDDDELTVYGINAGAREVIYNTSRFSLGFFKQWESGAFTAPIGIAADPNGWVAVSDMRKNHIVYLRNELNALVYVKTVKLQEMTPSFQSPCGVAIEEDKLYVADSGNNRLVVLDSEGEYLNSIDGCEGSFRFLQPFAVAVITEPVWNHYQSRFIVVTDSLQQRLSKLTMDGVPLAIRRFTEVSANPGGFYFVAVDYYSNVYATDTLGGCIYNFDRHLNYVARFVCCSNPGAELDSPRGIAIHRRFGQIFVAERSGASYFWIGTDIVGLSCEAELIGSTVALDVRFSLTEQSEATICLEDGRKNVIHIFDKNSFTPPGIVMRHFSLERQTLPCELADCMYYLTVMAKATYSSKKYLEVMKRVQVRIKE